MKNFRKSLLCAALTFMVVALLGQGTEARDNPNDHPIRILKAKVDTDSRGFNDGGRGTLTIWLKNAAEVTVDGITVTVDLYDDRRRKINTLTRDIDPIDGGEKRIVTMEWDEFEEVKPRYFIEYYSRGKQKSKFEGDRPSY